MACLSGRTWPVGSSGWTGHAGLSGLPEALRILFSESWGRQHAIRGSGVLSRLREALLGLARWSSAEPGIAWAQMGN
eukprot:15444129-Alexandrium_andersonii.AAC.1